MIWLLVASGCLLLYAAIGVFARPVLDDWCLAAYMLDKGALGTVSYQYWTWSGNVMGLVFQVAGPALHLYHVGPLLQLTLWTVTFAWFLWEAFALIGLRFGWLTMLLAGMLLALMLVIVTPNIGQTLYWYNGTANYGPTTAFFVMMMTVLLRLMRTGAQRWHYWASVLLVFVAVLGQITMVVYCIGLLVPVFLFALAYAHLPQRRALIRLLLLTLAAAVIGAAIVMLSPGNDMRQGALNNVGRARIPFGDAILRTFPAAFITLSMTLVTTAFAHLSLFSLAHLTGLCIRSPALSIDVRTWRFRLALITGALIVGGIIFYVGNFASIYTMGIPNVPRAWVPSQVFWILLVVLTGYIHGLSYPPAQAGSRAVFTGFVVSSAAFFALLLMGGINILGDYRTFASEHDARIVLVEAAVARGDNVVTVPRYTRDLQALMNLSSSDDRFCMSQFYGLDAIVVEQ